MKPIVMVRGATLAAALIVSSVVSVAAQPTSTTRIALGGYHGPALAGAVPGTQAFGVTVRGAAGARVRIRAIDVPAGSLASFCTRTVCAPFAVRLVLPASGTVTIELQIIKNDRDARPPTIVTVATDDGARASIPYASGTHAR